MRKIDLRKFAFLLLLLCTSSGVWAQAPLIWGTSPFQDSMWSTDTTTYTVVQRIAPSLTGFTITGITAMAWDPVGHKTYVVMKLSGVAGRDLATIDLNTGVCTHIGNLGGTGANYSTLAFRSDGQLFGVIGNGGNPTETMFMIDKNTAATTLAVTLGNGADGEIICYNYDDDMFYHWSGNGTVVMEKFPAQAPYTPITNIVPTGTSAGETFGALYIGNNNFIISNISSQFKHVSASGVYGNPLNNNPDDLRGLVMPPNASFDSDTVCVGDTVNWLLMPGQARDTAVYHWGDGTSTTVFPAASASHVYSTAGTLTSYMVLKNSIVGEDTLWSAPIRVNALPVVVLVPGADTLMCTADSLNIVATNGGTSQWYMNGAPITGANTNAITVTANGVYNMTKINLNGCMDSASVGISVVFGDNPVVDLGADSTVCDGDTVCFALNNPNGTTYSWSNGATTNSICVTQSGTVDVTVTDPSGCQLTDQAVVNVILAPAPNISIDSSNCPTFVFHANDPNGDTWTWDFGDSNTGTGADVTHTYATNGTYTVNLATSNACFQGSEVLTLTFDCIIGVRDGLANLLHISPNPSNGSFTLSAALPAASTLSYEISDISGRVLQAQAFDDVRSSWTEAVQFHAAQGLYFLTVRAADQMAVYRLVIE